MSDLKTKIVIETKDFKRYTFVSKITIESLKETFLNFLNFLHDEKVLHICFSYESGSLCFLPTYLLTDAIITLKDYDK